MSDIYDNKPEEVVTDSVIRIQGNSKVIFVSEQCKMLGLNTGDIVRVTIRKL